MGLGVQKELTLTDPNGDLGGTTIYWCLQAGTTAGTSCATTCGGGWKTAAITWKDATAPAKNGTLTVNASGAAGNAVLCMSKASTGASPKKVSTQLQLVAQEAWEDITVTPAEITLGVQKELTLTDPNGDLDGTTIYWCLQAGTTAGTSCGTNCGGGWKTAAIAWSATTAPAKAGTITVTTDASAVAGNAVLCMSKAADGASPKKVSTQLQLAASGTDGDASGAFLASPLALTGILCLISWPHATQHTNHQVMTCY